MVGRPLCVRIEAPDGFDLIAEELHAHGPVHLRAIHIDDAAAHRDLPGHLDDVHTRVPDRKQMFEQHLRDVLFALAQLERERSVVLTPKQPHAGRFHGRDDEPRLPAGDLPQRGRAPLLYFAVRGKILEGQDIVRGQPQHLMGLERTGEVAGREHGRVQRLGGVVIGDQHQRRSLPRAHEVGQIQGARGRGKPGDTAATRAPGQVATHTRKRLGAFQIRNQLADEGKNHATSVYQRQALCSLRPMPCSPGRLGTPCAETHACAFPQAAAAASRYSRPMSDSMRLAELLLPELEAELAKTRKVLERVPDGHNDFKSAEKSMPLTRLAGHTAEFAGFITVFLTTPSLDMGTPEDPRKILRMETRDKLLAEFDELAPKAIETLKATSDETFGETWTASRKGQPVFTGTRYAAYRNMLLNHMIHHRAQLGVYLRLLDIPVPSTFGPTADEQP